MSYTPNQIADIEAQQQDFDLFLSQRNWDGARAIVDNLGDEGYENEALFLHKALNRAIMSEDETPTDWEGMRQEIPNF